MSRMPNLEPDYAKFVVHGQEALNTHNALIKKEYPICNVYRSVPIGWGTKLTNPGYWRFRYQKHFFRTSNWYPSERAREVWDELEAEYPQNIVVRRRGML
ncbi:Protein of unknown function [Pyronema omphalodes CBS 100304]|uniref:Uncharacterized protein n=1 Tax=Pyronema omphalodes (strain CBS 100304) TaxID=1076935 RepID=U4LFQ5_PYROM|nr:Protein of unknown function [Pyronema omphalodes CBS 100304]